MKAIIRTIKFGLLSLFSCLLILGCTHRQISLQGSRGHWVQPTLPAFNAVKITGPFDVYIDKTQGAPVARYDASAQEKPPYLFVRNRVLHVLPHHLVCPRRVALHLLVNELLSLELGKGARLMTKNIPAGAHLTLIDHQPGNLTLRGTYPIARITKTAPGLIDIRWIKSDKLDILATHGAHIRLSGTVNHLRAQLADNSLLDAKHLRAQHAWVRTQDNSVAQVFAIKVLNTFAHGNSLIDYYKHPQHLYEHVYDHANVTPIASWQ